MQQPIRNNIRLHWRRFQLHFFRHLNQFQLSREKKLKLINNDLNQELSKRTSKWFQINLKSFRCLAAHSSLQYSIIYLYIYSLFQCNFWAQAQAGQVFSAMTSTLGDKTQLGVSHMALAYWWVARGSNYRRRFDFFLHLFFSFYLAFRLLVKMSKLNLGTTLALCTLRPLQ